MNRTPIWTRPVRFSEPSFQYLVIKLDGPGTLAGTVLLYAFRAAIQQQFHGWQVQESSGNGASKSAEGSIGENEGDGSVQTASLIPLCLFNCVFERILVRHQCNEIIPRELLSVFLVRLAMAPYQPGHRQMTVAKELTFRRSHFEFNPARLYIHLDVKGFDLYLHCRFPVVVNMLTLPRGSIHKTR